MRNTRSVGLTVLSVLALSSCTENEITRRQADVAEVGSRVMPFDLDRSTHVFEKTEFGGIQTVSSDDGDEDQIDLIRSHLSEEAERFSLGDFHDPQMIHGENMPGLHTLATGQDQLSIAYSEVDRGGEIQYSSDDVAIVEAIHAWFDAQVQDHGDHAQGHR